MRYVKGKDGSFRAGVHATLIAYVPPHSLAAVLEAAAAVLGPERRCVVARELTKLHEELFRTSLGGASEHYALNAPRVRPCHLQGLGASSLQVPIAASSLLLNNDRLFKQ